MCGHQSEIIDRRLVSNSVLLQDRSSRQFSGYLSFHGEVRYEARIACERSHLKAKVVRYLDVEGLRWFGAAWIGQVLQSKLELRVYWDPFTAVTKGNDYFDGVETFKVTDQVAF